MIRCTILFIVILCNVLNLQAQDHHLSLRAGYTRSSAHVPNDQIFIGSGGASRGNDWFDWTNGYQLGLAASLAVGSDYFTLDLAPQYSKYGFESEGKIALDYLDFDLGISNLYCRDDKTIYGGLGFTPSLLISSRNIQNTEDFDLRFYLLAGFKFNHAISTYAQMRMGLLEVDPTSELRNFQFSLNLNISILEL